MLNNYRFKKSYVDPKNGDIILNYVDGQGNGLELITNKGDSEPNWPNAPDEVAEHAKKLVMSLSKD